MQDPDSGQDFTADFVLEIAAGEGGTIVLEDGTESWVRYSVRNWN